MVGYTSAVYNYLQEELDRVAPGSTPVRRKRVLQTPRSQYVSGEPATVETFCAELGAGELSQKLFGVVEKINKKLPEMSGTDKDQESVFPDLPGSHLRLEYF